MKTRSATLVLLVAAVACAATYFLVIERRKAPSSPGSGDGIAFADVPFAPRHSTPAASATSADQLAPPGVASGAESRDASAAAEAQLLPTNAGPIEAPERSFSGRVLGADGRAVANAEVFLAAADRTNGLPLERLDPAKLTWALRSKAATDEQGRFRVSLRFAGPARFAVRASGYARHERTIAATSEDAIDLGDVVVQKGFALQGRVIDAARVPVAGAQVRRLDVDATPAAILGSAEVEPDAVTLTDGRFTLADQAVGPWSLLIRAQDHPDELVRGVLASENAPQPLEIVLDDGAEIRGRVSQASPEVLRELWIRAVPDRGPATGRLFAGDRVDSERFLVVPRTARCAEDGTFVVRGLTRDLVYSVSARAGEHDPFAPVRAGPVEARAGAVDLELVHRAGTALEFRAVDAATSQPVTELDVRFGRGFLQRLANDDGSERRHFEDGRVRVVQGLEAIGGEPLELVVAALGYEPAHLRDVRVARGETTDLGAVRLVAAPSIAVRVVDGATDRPVVDAEVTLEGEPRGRALDATTADRAPWQRARTDADGRARLNALPGAGVRLRVWHPEFAPSRSEVAEISPISHELTVRLTAGGRVVVEVRDALGALVRGVRIRHTSSVQDVEPDDARAPERSKTDADGRLVFARLAPGEHTFALDSARAALPAGAPATPQALATNDPAGAVRHVVVVDGGEQTLTWTVPARGRVSGRITESAQPLSGATLFFAPRETVDENGSASLDASTNSNNNASSAAGSATSRGESASQRAEALVARTNGDGEFRLSSVELGSYRVTIVHASRALPFETELALDTVQRTFDVDLPALRIEGRIVDGDGRAIEGVRVSLERTLVESSADGDAVRRARASAQSDADGRYVLRGVQSDVDLVVEAWHPRFQPVRSPVVRLAADRSAEEVDLVLEVGAVLEVAVLRSRPECRVRATFVGAGSVLEATAPVGVNGLARFTGLRPGAWRLQLEGCVASSGENVPPSVETVITVELERANTARLELP